MKKILILLFALSVSFQVLADNLSDTNSFFRWAEKQYPEYFSPSGSETFEIQNYLARRYSKDTYLGTQGTSVFVYSPLLFKGEITRVGVISDFIDIYNQETYNFVESQLSQDDDYKSLKENSNKEAIEGNLGGSFVSDLEDEILKILLTTKDHQIDIINKKLGLAVTKGIMSNAEQQAITSIYNNFVNGELPKAQASAAELVVIATTELGKLMAGEIQGFVDASSCDQLECSSAEEDGEFVGLILGAVAGGIAGGIFGGFSGILPGAKVGATVGRAVGKAVGKFIGWLTGKGFMDGPGCDPSKGILC